MAVSDHHATGRQPARYRSDHRLVGEHPQAVAATIGRGGVDIGRSHTGAIKRRLDCSGGIAIQGEHLGKVRTGGANQLEAIDLGARQGVLVGQDDACGEWRQLDERDEPLARVFVRASRACEGESLFVAIKGRPRVLAQSSLGQPLVELRARIVVAGVTLATWQIQVHDIARVACLQFLALGFVDDVVGWGEQRREVGKPPLVKTERAKCSDACHG